MNPTSPAQNKSAAPVAADTTLLSRVLLSHSVYNPNEVGVQVFHEPGYRVELRAIRGKSPNAEIVPIIHDHHELSELLRTACDLNAQGFAAYHTINPLRPDIVTTAKDEDVPRIAWCPYDIDPNRPEGVSATDAEKAEEWKVAEAVISYWQRRGVDPVVVDSGNGYYVLVPVDLPVNDAGWVAGVLDVHAKEFNTAGAEIDTTAKNASRILRVPGTMNRKGVNTPERPHRLCKILSPGSRAVRADLKTVEGAVESRTLPVGESAPEKIKWTLENMRANFKRMKLPRYREQKRTQDGVTFYDFKFAGCLIEAHDEGDDSSLISVREDGVYAFSCFHKSHQYKWKEAKPLIEARFNAKFDFAGGTPLIGASKPTAAEQPAAEKPKIKLLSPSQLRAREKESGAVEQLVEGLLPRHGVSVLIGDSNIGKSPLVVQLAVCVAADVDFLDRPTRHGKAVLLDFENTGLLADMIYQTAKAVGARPVPSVKRIWLEEKATRAEEAALICACDEVAASVSNATAGSTSVVTVTFHRDSTDKNFSYAQVYLRGYNGNQTRVAVASGADSPITFVINNTGENVSIAVQAVGNSGCAPIDTAPTTGIKLPKSTAGGYGTGTTVAAPTQLVGDVSTSGTKSPLEATVVGFQGVDIANTPPNTSDTWRYNEFGDSKWDVVIGCPRFIQVVADGSNNPFSLGHNNQPVTIGTRTFYFSTATEPGGLTYTSAATGSTNDVVCIEQGFGASNGIYTYGALRRYSTRLIMNNTANVRYWIGLGKTSPQFGTAAYSTDTPNFPYAMFRYSSTTDSTIKAVCGLSSGSQTVVNTGVAVDTVNSQQFDIVRTGTAFKFLINGTLVATISTTLPAASDLYGTGVIVDNKNTATAVGVTLFHSTLMLK
jgi:hypothetical protein